MSFSKHLLFLWLCCFPILDCIGQASDPYLQQFSTNNGLSNDLVYDALCTESGYMWFATNSGVTRFDGKTFEHYTIMDGLCNNMVFGLYEDDQQRLWCYSETNCLSYFSNGSFHAFKWNDLLEAHIGNAVIWSLAVLENGSVWVGSGHCVLSIDTNGQIDHWFDHDSVVVGDAFLACNHQTHYVYGRNHISKKEVDYDTKRLFLFHDHRYSQHPLGPVDGLRPFGSFLQLENDEWIYVSGNHLIHLSSNMSLKTHVELPGIAANGLFQDGQGQIWVGLRHDGVVMFTNTDFSKPAAHYLKDKTVSSIEEDIEEGIWFTTVGSGIFYLRSSETEYFRIGGAIDGEVIRELTGEGNYVWIGTLNGNIYAANDTSKASSSIALVDSFTTVNRMVCNSSGQLAFSQAESGFRLSNPSNPTPFLLPDLIGIPFHYDSSGIISLSVGVLMFYDRNGSIRRKVRMDSKWRVVDAVRNTSGKIWIGGNEILLYYNGHDVENMSHLLPYENIYITSMLEYGRGLLMATAAHGLLYLEGQEVKPIKESNGLSRMHWKDMAMNKNGEVWLASSTGLTQLRLNEYYEVKGCQNFGVYEGLPFSGLDHIHVTETRVWASFANGVINLGMNSRPVKDSPPPAHLTRVEIDGNETSIQNTYNLTADQRNATLTFQGISYRDPDAIHYQYKLAPHQTEWKYSNSGSVHLANLPYGQSAVYLRVLNSHSGKASGEIAVAFRVARPLYMQWWLYALIASALALTVSWVVFLRNKRKRLQQELHTQLRQSKQAALKAQINPHFVFNALNSIQRFVLTGERDSSMKYMSQFGQLMRVIFANSDETTIPISQEIKALELYISLEQLRMNHKFSFQLHVDDELDIYNEEIPAMLIQPFVENAIWHGFASKTTQGLLTITLHRKGECVECIVEDDGVGRPKARSPEPNSATHESKGMLKTEQRLNLLYSIKGDKHYALNVTDLQDKEGQPAGTRVQFYIPLKE